MLLINNQEFLGANVLDDKPFIVMPFLKHGNALDYIEANSNCDRQKIVSSFYFRC
jgi:hypothetical protein